MLFQRKYKGRILSPRNRGLVQRHFRAEGTVESLPEDQHLLLVIQVDGLMWPKGKVQVNDGTWWGQVHEGGTPPDGRFLLSLYLVTDRGYAEIISWLERGKETSHYPGLRKIRGGTSLHTVSLQLKR